MPYDSQGNFHRVHNWEEDRQNDIEIVSDRHDEEDDNFAEGLSNCMLRDGRSPMTDNLNMNNCKIQNLANGTASKDAVNKSQLDTKANSSEVVKLTGSQTVAGSKTLTDVAIFQNQDLVQQLGTVSVGASIDFHQKLNGARRGIIRTSYEAVNKYSITLGNCGPNASAPQGVTVYRDASKTYATAPASDEIDSIVTTVAKTKAQNGYFKFGNGLIVQWGYVTLTSSQHPKTVTLPTAFTTTNYTAIVSREAHEFNANVVAVQTDNYTKTTFDFTANDPAVHWIAIGY